MSRLLAAATLRPFRRGRSYVSAPFAMFALRSRYRKLLHKTTKLSVNSADEHFLCHTIKLQNNIPKKNLVTVGTTYCGEYNVLSFYCRIVIF